MRKILSIDTKEQDSSEEIKELMAEYPVFMQARVREAFSALDEKRYEDAERICYQLLDYKPVTGIRILLGSCLFIQGNMQGAEMVFSDLVQDDPDETIYHVYHGVANHALGRFEEAAEELGSVYPVEEYYPFYNTSYGDSLLQIGRPKQGRDIFREEVAHFEQTGEINSEMMLDGAFQNLLYLDVTLGNGKYPEDVKLYYQFLSQADMTEEMQDTLADNIIYFCDLMSNKWYRPLFLELIDYVRDKELFTEAYPLEVLESAYASWESFAYHEDRQVSMLMETYLMADHKRRYTIYDDLAEEEKDEIEALAQTYEWYMCRYAMEHPEEIEYVKEHYPQSYAGIEEFLEKVRNDAEKTAKETLDQLYTYVRNTPRQEFEQSLQKAYQRACEDEKGHAYVYDGYETYRRIQPKVGRNDPCPCGSGKKYKKCCGR